MYKIVNDDWQQSEPQIFGTFIDAFSFYQNKTDKLSRIYYVTEEENLKVWDPEWTFVDPILEAQLENIYDTIREFNNAGI